MTTYDTDIMPSWEADLDLPPAFYDLMDAIRAAADAGDALGYIEAFAAWIAHPGCKPYTDALISNSTEEDLDEMGAAFDELRAWLDALRDGLLGKWADDLGYRIEEHPGGEFMLIDRATNTVRYGGGLHGVDLDAIEDALGRAAS